MMQSLKTLLEVKQKYPTSNLTKLRMTLSDVHSVHFIAYLSRIYALNELELTSTLAAPLKLLLTLPNLDFRSLSLTLPESGCKVFK